MGRLICSTYLSIIKTEWSDGMELQHLSPVCQGDDTMTGDGGEYLRPEDLRELGDDSLPGHMNQLTKCVCTRVCWCFHSSWSVSVVIPS
uniref:Uncharacterized protein n=1 Tax=Oryzias sinensis TaxID=183150 RepID=A0A8C7XSU2_9TELE